MTTLKPFRSMIIIATRESAGGGARHRAGRQRGQVRAVGQAGQRVVQGVVPQPSDEHLVVQRHRGVVGDGLQQLDVALGEPADLAEPVVHGEDAERLALDDQRRDDGLAGAACAQERRLASPRRA